MSGMGAPSRLDNHAVGVKMDLGFEGNAREKAFNMALEEGATFGLEAGDDVGVESRMSASDQSASLG